MDKSIISYDDHFIYDKYVTQKQVSALKQEKWENSLPELLCQKRIWFPWHCIWLGRMGNNQILQEKLRCSCRMQISGIASLVVCVWRMCTISSVIKNFPLLWTSDDFIWQKCTMTCIIKQFLLLIFSSEWKSYIYFFFFNFVGTWKSWILCSFPSRWSDDLDPKQDIFHILQIWKEIENLGNKSFDVLEKQCQKVIHIKNVPQYLNVPWYLLLHNNSYAIIFLRNCETGD